MSCIFSGICVKKCGIFAVGRNSLKLTPEMLVKRCLIQEMSFPRRRESIKNNKLGSRLRGNDELSSVSLANAEQRLIQLFNRFSALKNAGVIFIKATYGNRLSLCFES